MKVSGTGHSDAGRMRDNNEDAYWVDEQNGVFIVCDGVGGHAAGEIASQTAIETIRDELDKQMSTLQQFQRGDGDSDAIDSFVEGLVNAACSRIYHLAHDITEYRGMGCTLTMMILLQNSVVIGHVGDTRLYLYRNGSVHQLTNDHTLAFDLAQAGVIKHSEVKHNRYAHVLSRSLGNHEFVKVDTLILRVIPEDRFLLCSDGLSNYVDDPSQLLPYLGANDLSKIPTRLVDYANGQGGSDNVTAIAVTVEGTQEEKLTASKELSLIFGVFDSDFMFQDLYLSQVTIIMNAARFRDYEKGERIITEGTPNAKLYIIAKGKVSLTREEREPTILEPGETFGGTTLLRPRPCRATVTAEESTTLLTFGRSAMMTLIKKDPWLGVAMLERLGTLIARALDEGYVREKGYGKGMNGESLVGPNDLF